MGRVLVHRFGRIVIALCLLSLIVTGIHSFGQQVDPALFSDMRYRLVGPFRGGRALTATGVPGSSSVFYFGSVGGGVWKTNDAGLTWKPIFDGQSIASIGAMAVAPSDANVIYVGTGEADMREDITYGNGMYKSTDAGNTWTRIGLEDTRQIGRVLVDPKDANVVYVAALGHAYGANPERGVYRSTDGGKTWKAVLHKDNDTGAIDLAFDPQDSHTIYAAMWQTRRPPWNVYPPSNGPGSGLYKSTDSGDTWQRLEGLPTEGLGRIGVAVAPSDRNRVYAIVDAKDGGLYRSDDAGKTWSRGDFTRRIWGRGWYFGVVEVDPKNPDVVYVANTTLYKSVDGGKTFTALKGAPGGDDYHGVWIAPEDGNRMIVATDQGTIITLNGGKTWSSWYNQPTGQFYGIATDNRTPYWIYGAQQDSGAMAVPSRSNFASISERDWRPIPVGGESGTIAPDPADQNVLYGGTVSKFNWATGQEQNISPTIGLDEHFRETWTLPVVISQADPHKLYFSHQGLFRSVNGGKSWEAISGDLTRENPGVPANLDPVTAKYGLASPRKGVIFSIAPSPIDGNMVWVGTDDGLIHVSTDDGKTWKDVTPKELTPWSKVGILDASHFDKLTAYAAIDRHRLEDNRAYIYRTHDGGKSWQMVSKGIPEGSFVNSVREDTVRRGLLYAGTEMGVYVSFNDGDQWQPLQLNLPTASIRDIAIRNDDVIVATHGRAFWVLDNVAPLREMDAKVASADVHLFKPAVAYRMRPGSDQGTPYPPEIPHGDNPPNGATLDYYLKADAKAPVTLEILDNSGALVRKFASSDKATVVEERSLEFPTYWVKPPKMLSEKAGMHRMTWDMRYPSPTGAAASRRGGGVWALPGQYTVRLTVDGKSYDQALTLKPDPRVKVTDAELRQQFAIARQSAGAATELGKLIAGAEAISKRLQETKLKVPALAAEITGAEPKLRGIVGPPPAGFGLAAEQIDNDRSSMRYLARQFAALQAAVESGDAPPTLEQENAAKKYSATMAKTVEAWKQWVVSDLPGLNAKLKQAGVEEIKTTIGN
jgi:photosystem II stability/assembly factor-like uncharacterized protein